jgi:hypothetical protein
MDNHDFRVMSFAGMVCVAAGLGVSQVYEPVTPISLTEAKENAEEEADAVELLKELSEENGSSELNQEAWERAAREAEEEARELEPGV